jgi:hypothetical protein
MLSKSATALAGPLAPLGLSAYKLKLFGILVPRIFRWYPYFQGTVYELWWFRQTTGSSNLIYEEVRKWFR